MYCAKCGNLLKKEDNFCSICGTPNNADAKRASQGMSGFGVPRDDEPINLDDFFKFDQKKENALEGIDREIDIIKARAIESLARREASNASARRAARLARLENNPKAAKEEKSKKEKKFNIEAQKNFSENLNFRDDVFEKEQIGTPQQLVGRRGQLRNINITIDTDTLLQEPKATPKIGKKVVVKDEKITDHFDISNGGFDEFDEGVFDIGKGPVAPMTPAPTKAPWMPAEPVEKPKKRHMFREETIEMPNIFDDIAQSLQKSKDQDYRTPPTTIEETISTAQDEQQSEEVQERINKVIDDFARPVENMTEGVFTIPGKSPVMEEPIERNHRQEAELGSSDNLEYFRYTRARKKKGPSIIVVTVAILVIIVSSVGVKMLLAGDDPLTVFTDIKKAFSSDPNNDDAEEQNEITTSESGIEEASTGAVTTQNTVSELKTQGVTDNAKMLMYVKSKGINKNITEVVYNPALKFEPTTNYKVETITKSVPIVNNLFYTKDGENFYYTEKSMSALIQFNSRWIDFVNNGDKAVIENTKKNSVAHKNILNYKEKMHEKFIKFEIGEIRKGSDGYYVWTKETINKTVNGETQAIVNNWIYYLEPTENDMKIVSYERY